MMSTWRVNGKKRAIVISATLLSVISVGMVQAATLRPLSQYLIVQAAIEGVLVAAGGFPDCNENGVDDAQDIADLTSLDCNGNGIPDECELSGNDCNSDGRPDECGVFVTCDEMPWLQEQSVTASDVGALHGFGGSVSISDEVAIVGAPDDLCSGVHGGCAYVFRFDGSSWVEDQKLFASDATTAVLFGSSVFVSGETALVGSHGIGNPVANASGAAYVFRHDGTNWVEEQKLFASDAFLGDFFGESSLSLDGNRAVIGAHLKSCAAGFNCGAAYVYLFDGTNWIEEQKLTPSVANEGQVFGISVAISGGTVVVGASGTDCAAGSSCGAAYVYRFDGTNWIEHQKLSPVDAAASDFAGSVVSFDGQTIVLGATGHDCMAGDNCGAAYVFRFDGKNWIQTHKLTASDASDNDRFGIVAVSGDTIVVGANDSDCAVGPICTAAYVYHYDGTNWVEQQKLMLSDSDSERASGRSASLFRDTALVGKATVFVPINGGTVSFFDLSGTDCNCNGVADQCDDGGCNDNGIPDICEPDSDGDGIPDDCDICSTGDDAIDTDGDSVPDGCDVCPGGDDTLDTDGDAVPDDCDICNNNVPEACTFASPILAPSPHDILKNRYISVDPLGAAGINVGLTFDIRVELVSTLVNGVTAVGSHWWANGPDAKCISIVGPTQPATPPNWDACPTLHLTGCPIIPTSTYEIVAVVGGLASFPPLMAETQAKPTSKWWGDCIGFFDTPNWTPPNGIVGADDFLAAIKTFQDPNADNATHVSVTDMVPALNGSQINRIVNFDDVFSIIKGFQGVEYPGPKIELCP